MRKKHKHSQVVLMVGYVTILSMMTLVLLWTAEPGSFQYWARVGGVAIGWCIFLLSFTPLRTLANIKVITSKADTAIILLILVIFFLITAVVVINALAHMNVGMVLLFGLVGLGIFNVIRDIIAKLADRGRTLGKITMEQESPFVTNARKGKSEPAGSDDADKPPA